MWKQDFCRNVRIGSSSLDLLGDDKIETSVSELSLNTVQGWCTTGKEIVQLDAETGKDAWIWVILSLKSLEKEWISWIMSGQRNRSHSMESRIYTVPELTKMIIFI